jgi:hypothetical protein
MHPNTPVFVPEAPVLDIPYAGLIVPLHGYIHTCAVLSAPNHDGERVCIGYTVLGSMVNNHAKHVRMPTANSKPVHTRRTYRAYVGMVHMVCYWVGELLLA